MIVLRLLRHSPLLMAGLGLTVVVYWGMRLVEDRARLGVELKQAQEQLAGVQIALEQVEEAARLHRAHLARIEREARHWAEVQNELQQMEGQNAPLSPLLGHTAERLYQIPPERPSTLCESAC